MLSAYSIDQLAAVLSTPMNVLKASLWRLHAVFCLAAAVAGINAADEAAASGGLLASAEGVYNSSVTPAGLPWNTYNYCNAPHVNAEHYARPANTSGAELVYVNAVIRHHKVCFSI